MTVSSEQIERTRELACERRKNDAILRLLLVEFNLRPAKCRVLFRTALAHKRLPNRVSNISIVLCGGKGLSQGTCHVEDQGMQLQSGQYDH